MIRPHQLSITCLVIFVLAYAFHLAVEDAKLRIAVEGGHYQFEPAHIRLRVRVQPDQANRLLTVGIDSADGISTEGDEALDGDRARITRWVNYPAVPAGEYVAYAIVRRGTEETWRASTRISVQSRY